jgi:hypothetical protein
LSSFPSVSVIGCLVIAHFFFSNHTYTRIFLIGGSVLSFPSVAVVFPYGPVQSGHGRAIPVDGPKVMGIALGNTSGGVEGKDGAARVLGRHPGTRCGRMKKMGSLRQEKEKRRDGAPAKNPHVSRNRHALIVYVKPGRVARLNLAEKIYSFTSTYTPFCT